MKLPLITAFLALTASAFAATPGSFAPVTSTLTLTGSILAAPTILKNGNAQQTATWGTYKVTNAAILSECQRQGILTAGSVAGWKLYAIFSEGGSLSGFVISSGLETIWIDSVISVSRSDVTGFATKGKWVTNTEDTTISGSTTYLDGFKLSVSLSGVTYVSTCVSQISDKVVSFGVLSDPIWRPGSFKITAAGLSNNSDENESLLRGALSIGAAKANWDLGLSLLGFDGFGE